MLAKVVGAFLLVVGILLAVPLAWMVVAWLFASLWTLAKLLFGAALIYCGWRWLNDAPAWKATRNSI